MPPTQPHLSWYKGRIVADNLLKIRSDDPALLYGASIFTTMRVYRQSLDDPLTSWSAHRDRLFQTIKDLGWNKPDWDGIRQGVETLVSRYQVVRVAVFPNGVELITGRDLPKDLSTRQSQGIISLIVKDPEIRRSLPAYKTGNYLPCWLALNRVQQMGAKEAILVDSHGNWLETSTGNLWGWKDGQWWTPSLTSGILPGIRRTQLLNWLRTRSLPVEEVIWDANFIAGLESLAYTNCAIEIIPIHTVWQSSDATAYSSAVSDLNAEKRFIKDLESSYKLNGSALEQLRSFFTVY